MKLSGWGRYPQAECRVLTARNSHDAESLIANTSSMIARGKGRSYGDAAFNLTATLSMLPMDRLLGFDSATGLLTCEAGTTLADIIHVFVPRGWFPYVTPGTKFVTVGGAIAADVHGKNHHRQGAFGDYVTNLDILVADGRMISCSPHQEPELFRATCGGMGLTGVILRATIRLRPIKTAFIRQETLRARDLDETMAQFEASVNSTYSVAWIDCQARDAQLGRAILMRGEHADMEELPAGMAKNPLALAQKTSRCVPFDFPGFALNAFTVSAFNEFYYRMNPPGTSIINLDSFFYPLDAVLDWNRIYGRRGFIQYQCILPYAESATGLRALLTSVVESGFGSFLAVLKLLGPQRNGFLSFPMEGYTLALDFPAKPATFALCNALDAIVAHHGGRVYMAKDARMNAEMLRKGYPDLNHFQQVKQRWDSRGIFQSSLSKRLGL